MAKTETEAKKSLMGLFLCFLNERDDRFAARFEAYSEALGDLTPDEICLVCAMAVRGEIGNPTFMPSAAQLHAAARPLAVDRRKPPPQWAPNQDRFLSKSGMLFVTSGGRTEVYTPEELADAGYSPPAATAKIEREEPKPKAIEGHKRGGRA